MRYGKPVKITLIFLGLISTGAAWGAGRQPSGGHGGQAWGSRPSFSHSYSNPSFGNASRRSYEQNNVFRSAPQNNRSFQTNQTNRPPQTGGVNRGRNDVYSYTHQRPTDRREPSFQETNRGHNHWENSRETPRENSRNAPRNTVRNIPPATERGNIFSHQQNRNNTFGNNDRFHRSLPDGSRITQFHGRTEIQRPNGSRTIQVRNAIVRERPFTRNNTTFIQRTYVRNNYVSVRNYQVCYWGGRRFYSYVPYYVYPSPFFVWVWDPWVPVHFAWWWYDDPWYGYYGYYWRPYPVYYGPAFWLTDFVIADILADAYAHDAAAAAAQNQAYSQAGLDEKIKNEVRKEVEAELKARGKNASVPIDHTLGKGYVHVITKDINVAVADSNDSCALTPGDVLKVVRKPSQEDQVIEMNVVSSKRGGCPPNKHVLVSMEDVQDMNNHFSESIDRGLAKLHEKQGKDGLPAAPKEAQGTPQESITPQEKDQAVKQAEDEAKTLEQPTQGQPATSL